MDAEHNGSDTDPGVATDDARTDEPTRPRIDWEDPSVPVGNAPALPRWPLAVMTCAWLAWVVFLAVMMLGRGSPAS